MWIMQDHKGNTITRSGLTVTGAGTARLMYMFKRQVTGTDQDRDTHMLLVAGSQLNAENPGQKATGRKITSREITDSEITDSEITGRVITATGN
jgi:hypothetical protein